MTIVNRYIKRSRISEAKFREFVKCFSLHLDTHQTALLIARGKFPEACFVPICLRYSAACCGEIHFNLCPIFCGQHSLDL
jgi:hypothetical protein